MTTVTGEKYDRAYIAHLEAENRQLRKALEKIRDMTYNGRSAVIMATDALMQSPDVRKD